MAGAVRTVTALGPAVVHLQSRSLSLDLCASTGGSIAAFRWHRPDCTVFDLLRPETKAAIHDDDVEGMSCFPLTPFSNRLRNGECDFHDRRIAMPRNTDGPHVEHGHGWQRPWRITEVAASRATLVFNHQADTWPFPYEMRQQFRLFPDRLEIELTARNRGNEAMPYGFGLHPYFPRTADCTLTTTVTGFWETDTEVMPTRCLPVPTDLDPRLGLRLSDHKLDNVFAGWDGKAVIEWPEHSARLTITANGPLHHLVLYTPPGEDYFCAEPVSNCTDAFNLATQGEPTDTGMLVLEPAETVSASLSLIPEQAR